MSFCPKCGRQRSVNARFCGGCGNDFGQPTANGGTATAVEPTEPPAFGPAEPTRWDTPAEPTRWDAPAEPTRLDALPDSQPAPAYPPPAPVTTSRRSGGRWTAVLVIVVILVVLGAGGGAYALTRSHGRPAAQPSSTPTVTAQASSAPSSVQAPASPTASASATPTTSLSVSVTPSPTRTGTVQVAPGVAGNPAEPRVEAYLNRYFSSINTRNYGEYNSLLDAQEQQADTESTFDSGYATTKDSNEVLTGIADAGGGNLTANVSFTSHQSPADSVDKSACNNWQISYNLMPRGNSYVMAAAQSSYTDC